MARKRNIRRLAFQALYQLDATGGDEQSVRLAIEGVEGPTPSERERAAELAFGAWRERQRADEAFAALAPDWPAHRQAAVDRAILRLAHHEMTSGQTPPKVAVNEAVELAKAFSTERSPAFINGLLDKVLKQLQGGVEPSEATGR